MKQTRAGSQKEAPGPPSNPQDVIELDSDEGSDNDSNLPSAPSKRSWVWNHFHDSKDGNEAICQVIINKKICGRTSRKDQSGSTKNFHEHLMRIHRLVDPKLGKKIDQAQANMAKYLKTAKFLQKVCLLVSFNVSFFLLILSFITQAFLKNETLKTEIS